MSGSGSPSSSGESIGNELIKSLKEQVLVLTSQVDTLNEENGLLHQMVQDGERDMELRQKEGGCLEFLASENVSLKAEVARLKGGTGDGGSLRFLRDENERLRRRVSELESMFLLDVKQKNRVRPQTSAVIHSGERRREPRQMTPELLPAPQIMVNRETNTKAEVLSLSAYPELPNIYPLKEAEPSPLQGEEQEEHKTSRTTLEKRSSSLRTRLRLRPDPSTEEGLDEELTELLRVNQARIMEMQAQLREMERGGGRSL